MKRRFLAAMILAAALLAVCAPAHAEAVWYGTMMVDHCEEWVSLRDVPGTGGNRLAKVPLFAIVTDAEWEPICGDFIYCNYDGQFGYILSKYLEPWADPEPDEEDLIRAEWSEAADDALMVDRDGEYVALEVDEPVTDARLLALELADFGEDGSVSFDTEVLYALGILAPEEPLIVQIAFPGDLPSYGVQFVDGEGNVRRFAIQMSGRDGSLFMEEF